MVNITKIDNNYIIDNKDLIIINGLFKRKITNNNLNENTINKIIKKLDKYSINYNIDNKIKIFSNNKYNYYKIKFENIVIINNICKSLEDNILRKDMKKVLKEIENIIYG